MSTSESGMAPKKIIAVIPAYNEATRVEKVINDAKKFVAEIVVVDDGSSDDTSAVAQKAGAIVVQHCINCGAGAATMTGIEVARLHNADIVVTLDADGQHDPNDIPIMLNPVLNNEVDAAFANRFGQRNRIPMIRRIANGMGNIITFITTGRWVPDSQCGFKVFGPAAIEKIDLRMSGYEFCTEIVRESVEHKWRLAHVPTKVMYSEYTLAKGQSYARGIQTALRILLRSFIR